IGSFLSLDRLFTLESVFSCFLKFPIVLHHCRHYRWNKASLGAGHMAFSPLQTVLSHIRNLAGQDSLSDRQLLTTYTASREEPAFACLLRRHGPMVLSIGWRILRNEHDAEDVFQATFLLLARKAGSIRKRESVSSWLHGVALRLAMKARSQNA